MRNKTLRCTAWMLAAATALSSCSFMSNSEKGYVAGSVGGTILGATLGAAVGGDHGADVGAHLGMVVGGVTGAAAGAAVDAEEASSKPATVTKTTTTTTGGDSYYDKDTGKTYTKVSTDGSMLFQARSSELDSYARQEIEDIAGRLGRTSYSEIVIYGSTDDTESRDYSYELSCERADAVADYLVELGIPAKKITTIGLGSDCPIDENDTIEGRAANRCVEVYIVEK